ncbi:hypothetical protein QFC22_005445 [Naganishia vaughanmartiniae]|uniref:Uncharacterized protein n=1 Tax=Naganishia vaughanmartiniae TaxID=1424756 RepID=A0ACC2WUY6_9TREE|nr:hypothetical protein QFC22_005445 [Naganishia vaughanmartiniae]
MPAVVLTPQLSQEDRIHLASVSQDIYGNPASLSINISAPTPLRQSSHRLESTTQVVGKNITSADKSRRTCHNLLPVTSVDSRPSSSSQSRLPLDNQGIANVDAAIHAWRQDIGQNHSGESRFYPSTLSPPAAPSLQKDTTFNPSTSCIATNKFPVSSKPTAERAPALSGCVERAALARGNSEVSKQCTTKVSVCEPPSLEAKRQKDLIVTEKMIARIFDSPKSQFSGSEIDDMVTVLQTQQQNSAAGLPSLKCFIKEIWTRTRSSRAVLWLARKYLERLSAKILPQDETGVPLVTLEHDSPLNCSRRSFLAALMLAHKHLVDKAYTNRAWHKVSTLCPREIQTAELQMAFALDFDLRFPADDFFEEYPEQRERCMAWLKQSTVEEEEPLFVASTKAQFFPESATACDDLMEGTQTFSGSLSGSPENMLSVPMPRLGGDINSAFSSMTGSFTFISPAQVSNGRMFCNPASVRASSRIPSLITDLGSDCSSVENRSMDGDSRDASRESSPTRSDGGNSASSGRKRDAEGQSLGQDIEMPEAKSAEAGSKKRKILRENGMYLECRL